ncbi:DUF4468 domain-containing protein [Pedobacter sp. UYP1]|uniref:DUF4468 domain-containing protein n=1 Tax=Pedobacter sp. UYP1 TaxID=1756396 RepID=UPI003395185B
MSEQSRFKDKLYQSLISEYFLLFWSKKDMKKLTVLLALTLCTLFTYCQEIISYPDFGIPVKNGMPFYELIDSINVKGKNKDQIYDACRKAFADIFTNSKSVIELENKQDGGITGKGITSISYKIGAMGISDQADINFSINFQSKDSKYRIQLYDINGGPYKNMSGIFKLTKKYRTSFFTALNSKMEAFLTVFSSTINENMEKTSSDF